MGSDTYHEPYEVRSSATREMHRAIVSLMEESEAIDRYQQRMDGCTDDDLREILRHNKDEEVEHAALTLEWIRRHSVEFDRESRDHLFTDDPIPGMTKGHHEKGAKEEGPPVEEIVVAPPPEDNSLRIRNMRT